MALAAQNHWTVLVLGDDVGLAEGPIGSGLAGVNAILDAGAVGAAETAGHFLAARSAIESGNLVEADRCLARAEDDDIVAAQTDFVHGAERMARAQLSRRLRARVADARGDLGGAARNYARALRYVPVRDHHARAQLTLMQVEALARQALLVNDQAVMTDAARLLRELVGSASTDQLGWLWTEAHLRLGGMLGWLGEVEADPARLEQAADTLRETLAMMPAGWPAQGRLTAQRGIAEATALLLDQAPVQPTSETGPPPADAPAVKISVATPVAELEAMVTRLEPRFAREPGAAMDGDWIDAGGSLAAALAELGRRQPPPAVEQLERAAGIYETVLASAAEQVTPLAAAELGAALAGVLWTLGLRTSDPARLTFATQAQLAALDAFEAAGAAERAVVARAELSKLAGDLARLSNLRKRAAKAG